MFAADIRPNVYRTVLVREATFRVDTIKGLLHHIPKPYVVCVTTYGNTVERVVCFIITMYTLCPSRFIIMRKVCTFNSKTDFHPVSVYEIA